MLSIRNAYIPLASGLAGFFIRASTEDGGTQRTYAAASSRHPHKDMDVSLSCGGEGGGAGRPHPSGWG